MQGQNLFVWVNEIGQVFACHNFVASRVSMWKWKVVDTTIGLENVVYLNVTLCKEKRHALRI